MAVAAPPFSLCSSDPPPPGVRSPAVAGVLGAEPPAVPEPAPAPAARLPAGVLGFDAPPAFLGEEEEEAAVLCRLPADACVDPA
jgi:hypothetical protein